MSVHEIEELHTFFQTNDDILSDLSYEGVLEIFEIFRETNVDYGIQNAIEENNDDSEIVNKYNEFAKKYYGFNRFINGEWETKH